MLLGIQVWIFHRIRSALLLVTPPRASLPVLLFTKLSVDMHKE
jgi:hypothetical protein